MTHPWREAARSYEARRVQATDAKAPVTAGKFVDVNREVEEGMQQLYVEMGKLALALERFIASDEGIAAMELLRSSECRIVFEAVTDGDFWDAHFLSGDGLRSSSGNAWRDRDREVQADIRKLAERTIYRRGEKTADAVMSWLRGELDKIASETKRPIS